MRVNKFHRNPFKLELYYHPEKHSTKTPRLTVTSFKDPKDEARSKEKLRIKAGRNDELLSGMDVQWHQIVIEDDRLNYQSGNIGEWRVRDTIEDRGNVLHLDDIHMEIKRNYVRFSEMIF